MESHEENKEAALPDEDGYGPSLGRDACAHHAALYTGARSRPPIPLPTMLHIYFLQQWLGYSDPVMEEALLDNQSMRIFARVEAHDVPDETTMCTFVL